MSNRYMFVWISLIFFIIVSSMNSRELEVCHVLLITLSKLTELPLLLTQPRVMQ